MVGRLPCEHQSPDVSPLILLCSLNPSTDNSESVRNLQIYTSIMVHAGLVLSEGSRILLIQSHIFLLLIPCLIRSSFRGKHYHCSHPTTWKHVADGFEARIYWGIDQTGLGALQTPL